MGEWGEGRVSYSAADRPATLSHASAREESSPMAASCPATFFSRALTSPASLDASRFDEAYASRSASASRTFAS